MEAVDALGFDELGGCGGLGWLRDGLDLAELVGAGGGVARLGGETSGSGDEEATGIRFPDNTAASNQLISIESTDRKICEIILDKVNIGESNNTVDNATSININAIVSI